MAILYQATFTTDSNGYSSELSTIIPNLLDYFHTGTNNRLVFNDNVTSAKVVYDNEDCTFRYGWNNTDTNNIYFSFTKNQDGSGRRVDFANNDKIVRDVNEGTIYTNASFEIIIEGTEAEGFLSKSGLEYLWTKLKAYFQDKLVSGSNIKTINNTSLLGSGNIDIQGGSSDVFVAIYGETTYQDFSNAVDSNKTIILQRRNVLSQNYMPVLSILHDGASFAISTKVGSQNVNDIAFYTFLLGSNNTWSTLGSCWAQKQLESGTSIKTINNENLLGSGNISIPSVTVDDTISDTSTNPVQNKAIKLYIDEREPSIEVQGDWHYRIYNDGSFEAWYGKDKVSITINNASGTLYRSNLMNLVLPTNLTNQGTTEIVSYSIGAGHNNYPVWATVASKTATQINYYVLSGGSRNTSPNYMLNAYVYGLISQ